MTELADFINEAIANGWPDNTAARDDDDFPDFYGGNYRRGSWRHLDIWSGATTDAGMMVVFFDEKPVWNCAYRGGILRGSTHVQQTTIEDNELFNFLITALRAPQNAAFKLRGPAAHVSEDGQWRYTFELRGDVVGFTAAEQIYDRGSLAYERILIGGCIGDGVAYAAQSLLLNALTVQ